ALRVDGPGKFRPGVYGRDRSPTAQELRLASHCPCKGLSTASLGLAVGSPCRRIPGVLETKDSLGPKYRGQPRNGLHVLRLFPAPGSRSPRVEQHVPDLGGALLLAAPQAIPIPDRLASCGQRHGRGGLDATTPAPGRELCITGSPGEFALYRHRHDRFEPSARN